MKQLTAYVAASEFKTQLQQEILLDTELKLVKEIDNVFLVQGPCKPLVWSQNQWLNPVICNYSSIKDAQNILRNAAKHWHLSAASLNRRALLIQEGLPKWKIKTQAPYQPISTIPLASYAVISNNEMIYSSECQWPYPDGKIPFAEDHLQPPSRAYLKLWEVFTRLGVKPTSNDLCIDLGACPGGWTWVLTELGAHVISVDRSPLDEKLMANPLVNFTKKDAFQMTPDKFPNTTPTWILSDLICYPSKLLEFIHEWLQSGTKANFICTIKFQGHTDFAITKKFLEIPGSTAFHLWANKHEVTWALIQNNGHEKKCPSARTK